MNPQGILSSATQSFITSFHAYYSYFISWGEGLFGVLITIDIVWMALWYAFDKDSLVSSLGSFLRNYLIAALFFTVLINQEWLYEVFQGINSMGASLTGVNVISPSDLVSQGLSLGDNILKSVQNEGLLSNATQIFLSVICYIVILFAFFSLALSLAVAYIAATGLICVSSLFMGFAGLRATQSIARNVLDAFFAECVKILGILLVVAVFEHTIYQNLYTIVTQPNQSNDTYAMTAVCCLLFWLIGKYFPDKIARIVQTSFQGANSDAAAMTMAAISYASTAMATTKLVGSVAANVGNLASGVVGNMGSNVASSYHSGRMGGQNMFAAATTGTAVGLAKSVGDMGNAIKTGMGKTFSDQTSSNAGQGTILNAMSNAAQSLHDKASQNIQSIKGGSGSVQSSANQTPGQGATATGTPANPASGMGSSNPSVSMSGKGSETNSNQSTTGSHTGKHRVSPKQNNTSVKQSKIPKKDKP